MIRGAFRNSSECISRLPPSARRSLLNASEQRASRQDHCGAQSTMSYVKKSLVPGETLLYETRHHWLVLLGPLLLSLLLVAVAIGLVVESVQAKDNRGAAAGASSTGIRTMEIGVAVLVVIAIASFGYGLAK